jgi:5-methylcytosine-specific restriction endonuclease McrA
LKNVAKRYKVPFSDIRELWFEQEGKCRYTNVKLVLGEIGDLGASLDHKIPVTKGGSNQKDNLQWVSYFVNSAKGNKTHDEFIEFCKQIVNLYER